MARPQPISQAGIHRRVQGAVPLFLLLFMAACRSPTAGVLTLAPAGMHTTGPCTPEPDGTLTMAAGASADATAYVEAGTVTVTVTAAPASPRRLAIEMWLADAKAGRAVLQSPGLQTVAFHAHARAGGPATLRLLCTLDGDDHATSAPTIHVEKIVITQP